MNNTIIFRFNNINKSSFFEVSFDQRLSFIENFDLLKDIYPINITNFYIYDREMKDFLLKDIPLKEFSFSCFKELDLFLMPKTGLK